MNTQGFEGAVRATITDLRKRKAEMEEAWEGWFVPRDNEKAQRKQAMLFNHLRILLGEMEETCAKLEAKAKAARLPPLLRQQLQGLADHFGTKRDEIERRLRPQ